MTAANARPISRAGSRPAFSLIEMMIVIGLVVLLAVITVVVGRSVVGKAKVDQCRQVLQTLDATLTEYQAERGGIPPFQVRAYMPPSGIGASEARVRREIAVYLEQVQGFTGIDKQLATIDSSFLVKRQQIYTDLAGYPYAGRVSSDDRASVRDPWGMEILYIHPTEENEKAFEAFGKPLNERPYFMSAGPDGEYETLDDNIYSYEVDKPREGRG